MDGGQNDYDIATAGRGIFDAAQEARITLRAGGGPVAGVPGR